MVSTAGGMALRGLIPVVHSFACFLSSRPNEQIYNNATEKTKVIYVGSLAGVLPGGPGHSHQGVRDIASLLGIPNLTILEPSCEAEVGPLLKWCINDAPGSCYMRLVSIPWHSAYVLPDNYQAKYGKGITIYSGNDAVIIAAGPVMLSIAVNVAQRINKEKGISLGVVNMPWLNYIDYEWLDVNILKYNKIFILDNHYVAGGLSDTVYRTLKEKITNKLQIFRFGVKDIPPSGTNLEVLKKVELDEDSIINRISNILKRENKVLRHF
jgi:transketolase